MSGPQGRWQSTVYSWSVTYLIILRKTQSSFTQFFAYEIFTYPSYQWTCCGLFLQSSEGFWISLPSFVQLLRCLLSFMSQKLSRGSTEHNFLLSICLWKYLFLSIAYLGNLPLNCRSICLSHINNLKNYFPGYLSTLKKPHGDVEWSMTWICHSCTELTDMGCICQKGWADTMAPPSVASWRNT